MEILCEIDEKLTSENPIFEIQVQERNSRPDLGSTVHFILVCQTIFGYNFLYSLLFPAETGFFMYSETKFQLDLTKDKEFPHRSPIIKIAYRHDVTKVGNFYNRGLWGKFSFLVGSS